MADVLVYMLAYAGQKIHDKIQDSRSPLIPLPLPHSSTSDPSQSPLDATEHFSELAPTYTLEPIPSHRSEGTVATSPPPSEDRAPPPLAARRTTSRTLSISSSSTLAPLLTRPSRSRSQSTPVVKQPVLTEHSLRELALSWRIRYQSLYLRLAALLDAMRRGLRNSWAGRVSLENCDQLRLAILEAQYVEKKLSKAVEWCEQQGLQKLPLKNLVTVGSKRRLSNARPIHSEYPPSLSTLPNPLPPAPPAILSKLTVALPPHVLRGIPEDDDEVAGDGDLPPSYTRHYDPLSGERLIQSASWMDERELVAEHDRPILRPVV